MMSKCLTFLVLFFSCVSHGFAHCQIPCGIYDDHARVLEMLQNAATSSKAIQMIEELASKKDVQSQQQRIRWVMNKEQHADNIIRIISDYFLTQRVKIKQKDYQERLKKHHAVMISAMKVKQNADTAYARILESQIRELIAYYPKHEHEH